MRLLLLLCALLLALVALAAEAGMKAGPNMAGPGHHRLKVPSGGGAIDGFTQPSGAFSFWKLRAEYAGSAFRIRRASDLAELDVGFVGYVPGLGAPWDEAAALAHCTATTCSIILGYDQSGNARNMPMGTTPPLVVFGCVNFVACARMTSAAFSLVGSAFTPATGVVTLSVVGNRSAGVGACVWLRENGAANRLQATAAGTWALTGGGGGIVSRAATDAAWHAAVGVINGASSVFNIDSGETTGTATGNTVAGAPTIQGGATTTCDESEWIWWDNYAMPPAERAAIIANQRSRVLGL